MHITNFSIDDVEALKGNLSEPAKISLIHKLQQNFKLDRLSSGERVIAEEILRFLASDISVQIRQNISQRFADNIALPRDIALKLAHDMEDIVSIPIIENSLVLMESDIVGIIETGSPPKQVAVAKRSDLTDNLCAHLIYRAAPEAIGTLINNEKIIISPNNSEILIKQHAKDQVLMRLVIQNRKITGEQAHNLLTSVSEDLRKLLIVEYNIPSSVVNTLVHESKESTIMNLIINHLERHPNSLPLRQIIDKLHYDGDLTFSILIKALSLGDITFFEAAVSKIADVPINNVEKLLGAENNYQAFKALYDKCKMPESMCDAVYNMMMIVTEEKAITTPQVAQLRHRILNRLTKASLTNKVNNLDYLVTIVTYNLRKSNLL